MWGEEGGARLANKDNVPHCMHVYYSIRVEGNSGNAYLQLNELRKSNNRWTIKPLKTSATAYVIDAVFASYRRRPSPKANKLTRDQAQKGLDRYADFLSRTPTLKTPYLKKTSFASNKIKNSNSSITFYPN